MRTFKAYNPPPVTFLSKDRRALAEHLLICHHQEVFGSQESEKRGRENEAAERKQRTFLSQHDLLGQQCLHGYL